MMNFIVFWCFGHNNQEDCVQNKHNYNPTEQKIESVATSEQKYERARKHGTPITIEKLSIER